MAKIKLQVKIRYVQFSWKLVQSCKLWQECHLPIKCRLATGMAVLATVMLKCITDSLIKLSYKIEATWNG
jgi:hypothetical protein